MASKRRSVPAQGLTNCARERNLEVRGTTLHDGGNGG